MIGLPMTFFQIQPNEELPQMLTLTVRFFEDVEAQRQKEEIQLKLAVPAEVALHMAEQSVNAVQLSRMPPSESSAVN